MQIFNKWMYFKLSSFFNFFKAVLCVLLKWSCCLLPIVLDKVLLTVCGRLFADVSFLSHSKFNISDYMALTISIYGIEFGAETKNGAMFNKKIIF